jgi:hypothetical protein
MKKYIILFFLFLLPYYSVEAFLGWNDGLNLYKNISENFNDYQVKLTQKELEWWADGWWIRKNINTRLLEQWFPECITKEISPTEMLDIILEDISSLNDFVSSECKNNNDNLTIWVAWSIRTTLEKLYNTSKNTADQKIERLQNIESIWLYSDGIQENSWFDLITDI